MILCAHLFLVDKPVCRHKLDVKYTAALGETIELVCSVIAKPASVKFTWKKSGNVTEPMPTTRAVGGYTAESVLHLVPR